MDATNQPLLDVRDLSVAFGRSVAVDGISFSIKRGECVALVGESGSGKSVSALSVLKLLPYPTASHPSGAIRFRGRDLLTASDQEMREVRGNDISIIFQEPMTSLNPLQTIETQIGEILSLHRGIGGAAARARTLELLGQVGIPEPETRLKSYPHQLSGGQRQRVMIAMALANEPDLLIADEPTTALDVTVQAQILELLRDISETSKTALMLITHDLGVVAETCTRMITMYAGEVIEDATVDEALVRPLHPYTSGLLRSLPHLSPRHGRLPSIRGRVPSISEMPAGCRFRARCAHAAKGCEAEQKLQDAGGGRRVRCHRFAELNLPGALHPPDAQVAAKVATQ